MDKPKLTAYELVSVVSKLTINDADLPVEVVGKDGTCYKDIQVWVEPSRVKILVK